MEFGQLVSNENQQERFKTFSTLKIIYTGCSIKEAILLLFQWSTKSFQNFFFFIWHVSSHCALQFQNTMCRVHHKRSSIAVSFADHLISHEKNIFRLLHIHFGQVKTNQNKNPSIRTLNIVKIHGAPKSSRLLHPHFGLILANQNKKLE